MNKSSFIIAVFVAILIFVITGCVDGGPAREKFVDIHIAALKSGANIECSGAYIEKGSRLDTEGLDLKRQPLNCIRNDDGSHSCRFRHEEGYSFRFDCWPYFDKPTIESIFALPLCQLGNFDEYITVNASLIQIGLDCQID